MKRFRVVAELDAEHVEAALLTLAADLVKAVAELSTESMGLGNVWTCEATPLSAEEDGSSAARSDAALPLDT